MFAEVHLIDRRMADNVEKTEMTAFIKVVAC